MRRWLGLWLGITLALAGACGDDEGPEPRIDRLAPPLGAVGARVEILGARFCRGGDVGSDGACVEGLDGFVHFGTRAITRADADRWEPGRITVTVPSGGTPGPTTVVVTVRGRPSNAMDFEVTDP